MTATGFTLCKYIQFKNVNNNQSHSHGNILKSHRFYRFLLQRNVDQFNFIFFKVNFFTQPVLKASAVEAQNYKFLHFFLLGQLYWLRDISETSEKSPPQKLFQLACDLLILMDSAIICIHFRNTQLTISLKVNATSLIKNTLAILY